MSTDEDDDLSEWNVGHPAGEPPALPPHVQEMIGRQLQRLYASLVEERIPETFRVLLDRLAATENPSQRA